MIPKVLHEHINGAFPANVCLVGVAMPDGYVQMLIQAEKDRDPERKGFAVLIRVERAEDLDGEPLKIG